MYRGDQRLSLLGFLLCPEGGGNLAWSPVLLGGTGRVRGFPGDLERRARPRRRRGESQGAGDSRGIPSRPRAPSGRPASWDRAVFRDEDVLAAWLEGRSVLLAGWRRSGFALQCSFLCPRVPVGASWPCCSGAGSGSGPRGGGCRRSVCLFEEASALGLSVEAAEDGERV